MTQTSYAILTRTGSSLLAQAVANDAPLSLTKIVIGQGTTTPTGSETALYDPLVTKDIADYGVSDSDSSTFWFTCFIPADEGPYSISEIGLLSADGSLIAIGHMDPAISKPVPSSGQTIDMVLGLYLKIDTASSITVSVADAESVSLSSMDTLPWLPVQSITEKAPPDTVTNGVVYYVPTGATGAWENLVGKLVQKATAGWLAVSPVEGHGIGLPDGTIYQYVSGAYIRVSAKLAEITSEASTRALADSALQKSISSEASARASADQDLSSQFLNYYTKTGSDARYLPLAGGTVDYLNSNGDIKIKTGKWLYTDALKDNGAGYIASQSPLLVYGPVTSKNKTSGISAVLYVGADGLATIDFLAPDGSNNNWLRIYKDGNLKTGLGNIAFQTWVDENYGDLSEDNTFSGTNTFSGKTGFNLKIPNAPADPTTGTGGDAVNSFWVDKYYLRKSDFISGVGLARRNGNPGYYMAPGGWIEQCGTIGSGSGGTTYIQFPIAFPTACISCVPVENNAGGNWINGTPTLSGNKSPPTNSQAIMYTMTWNGNTKEWDAASGVSLTWQAKGY